jgi:uncharacterized protein (TIGR01244 family)
MPAIAPGRRRFAHALAWAAAACALAGIAPPARAAANDAPPEATAAAGAAIRPLVAGVWVSGQVAPAEVERLKAQGVKAIVDVRPDGEEPGQPPSAAVEAAARAAGLRFAYAPVAGKDVPQAAVDAVAREIARPGNTVLVYCRSGTRATRAWALAEASRPDGLEAEAIESVAASAGVPIDDLREAIAARIATRAALDGRR